MSNELVKANTLSDDAWKLLSEAGAGNDFDNADVFLPWLNLVQGTSGYVKNTHENYIPGCKEGDITDNLTRVIRAVQSIIVVKYDGIHYTTFRPNGGAVIKQWFTDPTGYNAAVWPDPEKQFGKKVDMDGNHVVPAHTYYVLMLDNQTGAARPAVWALASTQYSKAKRVNATLKDAIFMTGPDGKARVIAKPPCFARILDLSSKMEPHVVEGSIKNTAGWVINPGDVVLMNERFGEAWTHAAIAFRSQIDAGRVRPSSPMTESDELPADGPARYDGAQNPPEPGEKLNDDIPF